MTIMINYRNLISQLFMALTLMAVYSTSNALTTICSVPCGTTSELRQYTYNGFLKDLTVSSSQELPFGLQGFHNNLGLTPNSIVPVEMTVNVVRYQEYFGDTISKASYDYYYSLGFSGQKIDGSVIGNKKYGLSTFALSPFYNDLENTDKTIDKLSIYDTDFNVNTNSSNVEFRSRSEANQPGYISIYKDKFRLNLIDESANNLNNEYPNDAAQLENLFAGGTFDISTDIQVLNNSENILVPFSEDHRLHLNGTISSSSTAFQPSKDEINTICRDITLCLITLNAPNPTMINVEIISRGDITPVAPVIFKFEGPLNPVPLSSSFFFMISGLALLFVKFKTFI